jgi:hypothetical protein
MRRVLPTLFDFESLEMPLFTISSCVKATLIHIRYAGSEFGDTEWMNAFDDFVGVLKHFGRRWNIAGK